MYLKFILSSVLFIVIIDWYYYRSFNSIIKKLNTKIKRPFQVLYWLYTFASICLMFYIASYFSSNIKPPKIIRVYVLGFVFIVLISKLIGCIFIVAHDIESLIRYVKKRLSPKIEVSGKNKISRKEFLKKTGVIVSAIPFGTLIFGMLKSAFDYTVKRKTITIENLPKSFKGLRIVQISDLHVGSFISAEPLETAIKIIKQQKPDIIFFTGDLVNDITEEALPFIETLKTITAPMGVYSILGNHDYGDYYYQQDDLKGKKHNYDLMKAVHAKLGWKLLLNESHILTKGNDRLAILGVENWGSALRFPKYGDIDKAKIGCLENDVKLLLSHDPSHWDAIILPQHKDIALTFSGHTHGMQFGIEIPGFKWSPSKYLYKQWAGLYQKNNQYIYVNRGLGFLGYPGRVGILPEITVIELN